MPTQSYRTRDGLRVPGVTTIIGRFKESGGLLWWANRLAYEPLMQARALLAQGEFADAVAIEKFLAIPPETFDHKASATRAADAGTIAHEMVECFIRKREFDASAHAPDLIEMARPAYRAFLEWADQSKLKVVETEKPLISEKHRFGGTRDAIFIQGKRAVGDWKTSNAIYVDYLLQLAAYGILDEEAGNTIDGGYHLVRFSKQAKPDDPVTFTHKYWSHLDQAKRGFLLMRELYDIMANLEKLSK